MIFWRVNFYFSMFCLPAKEPHFKSSNNLKAHMHNIKLLKISLLAKEQDGQCWLDKTLEWMLASWREKSVSLLHLSTVMASAPSKVLHSEKLLRDLLISSSSSEMCLSLRVHFTIFGGTGVGGRYANRHPSNPILRSRLTFTNYTIKSPSKEAIFENYT